MASSARQDFHSLLLTPIRHGHGTDKGGNRMAHPSSPWRFRQTLTGHRDDHVP